LIAALRRPGPALAALALGAALFVHRPRSGTPAEAVRARPADPARVERAWAGVQNEIEAALAVPPDVLARLAVGQASEGFTRLADWTASHPVAGRPAVMSLFSRDGRPLAWTEGVRSLDPRPPAAAAERIVTGYTEDRLVAERSLGEGLLESIRLEIPFSSGGRLVAPLTEVFGLDADRLAARVTLGGREIAAESGGELDLVTAAGAPLARLSLLPAEGQSERSLLSVLAGLAGLLAALLAWTADRAGPAARLIATAGARLAAPASLFAPWLPSGWTNAHLFARPAPFALLDSPLDLLLTGAAAAAASLCLAELAGAARGRRIVLTAGGFAALAALLPFVASIPASSRIDPLRFQLLSPEGPRVCLQVGAILFAACGVVLLRAAWTEGRALAQGPNKIAGRLAATALSALLAGLALSWGSAASARALIERDLAPAVRSAPETQERLMRETLAQAAERTDWDLGGDVSAYAFDAWRGSPLAPGGVRSAFVLLDEEGRRVSEFSSALPLGIDPAGDEGDGEAGGIRPVTFTLLTLRLPLLRGETLLRRDATPVGRLVVFLSRDRDNIPAFTRNDPLPAGLSPDGPDPVYDEFLGGEPVVALFTASGELISSTAGRPPALEPGWPGEIAASGPAWKAVEMAGRTHRFYLFPAGTETAAIGYSEPSAGWRLSGWTRLVVLALAGSLLLALPRSLRALLGGRWIAAIRESFARRLLVALLLASLLPLAAMSLALTSLAKRRSAAEVESRAVAALDSARRLLSDFAEAAGGPATGAREYADPRLSRPRDADAAPIGSNALYWLSRVVGQDLSVFIEGRLVATSRPDLYAAGVLSPALDPVAAEQVHYGRAPYLIRDGAPSPGGSEAPVFIYSTVDLPGWSEPGVLALPLTSARRALRQDAEAVGEGLLAMTVLFSGLIAGAAVFASRRISGPIRDITRSAARVAEGDYDVRIPVGGADETGRMTEAFNTMAGALSGQREDLRRRGDYIEKILLNATTGVISTGAAGIVRTLNPAARLLLDLPEPGEGRPLPELLAADPRFAPLARLLEGDAEIEAELDLVSGGATRRLRVVRLPLVEREGDPPGQLILVEDLTEVARSNRLEAWADMARRIAHEIKNPLTPIQLSAEHLLALRRSADPEFDSVLENCLATILEQVRNLREISGEFSDYARLPDLRPVPTDLARLVSETSAGYSRTPPPGTTITVEVEPVPSRPIDPRVFRRALVNLIENAIQAASPGRPNRVSVRLRTEDSSVVLDVRDSGEGMSPRDLERAFEPYFSTRGAGTGLGLPIARRAVEEHG
jgi:signal transduction histidine kinase/HAMP domain-containing protein